MKQCQTCGEKIPDAATICPRCQQRQSYMGPSGLPSGSSLGESAAGNAGTVIAGVAVAVLVAGAAAYFYMGHGAGTAPLALPSSPSVVAAPSSPAETPPPPPQPEASSPPGPVPGTAQDGAASCTAAERSSRFAAVVKKRLENPASFELVRTTTTPVGGDRVTIIMTYRAIKGSGPPRTGVAIGKVTLIDCAVKIDLMT